MTGGEGPDIVVTTCGSVEVHEQAIEMVAHRGYVNLFGGLGKNVRPMSVLSNTIHYKECFVTGSHGCVPLKQVGQLYEEGEIFVPEMLVAARAMSAALAVLKPQLVEARAWQSSGKVAIGTVQGDLHDIGKNLVAMMLEGSGFEIVDLGVDVPAEKFVEAIRGGANVVAMSALLTTTMTNMKAIIEAISGGGAARARCGSLVGGAPITKAYADEIGADGYATDASSAVRVAGRGARRLAAFEVGTLPPQTVRRRAGAPRPRGMLREAGCACNHGRCAFLLPASGAP